MPGAGGAPASHNAGAGGVALASGAGASSTDDLQPSASCKQPAASPSCKDGFCRIEPGCFIMGAPRNEWGAARYSDVQVEVTLTRPFLFGQHEITYADWVAEGFPAPKRDILDGTADCREPSCPISNVSLFDAVTFANKYSQSRGLPPCYELSGCTGKVGGGQKCRAPTPNDAFKCEGEDDALDCQKFHVTADSVYACTGYRLPTEAEWEYATRAGTRTAFWTGAITPEPVLGKCQADPNLLPIAWYCANSEGRAHPVGGRQPNPWGLQDLLGNVLEYTTDVFNGLGYGTGPLTDPIGSLLQNTPPRDLMPAQLSDGDSARTHGFVSRGGAHVLSSSVVTANDRTAATGPNVGSSGFGFRLTRSLER